MTAVENIQYRQSSMGPTGQQRSEKMLSCASGSHQWISPDGFLPLERSAAPGEFPLPKTAIGSMIYFGAFFFSGEGNFVKLLNYEFNDYRRQRIQSCKENLSRHIQEHKLCFETFLSITL